MAFSCLFGRHEARASAVRNQGFYFSRCLRCERDMVRSLGRWQVVPRGFRVVWRDAGAGGPISANLPVPRGPAASDRGAAGTLSRLAAFGAMAGAGFRALAWSLGDRLDNWVRRAGAQRRPALLRLPAP